MNPVKITFFVPSHKEGKNVEATVALIESELKKLGIESYEFLVSNCFHEGDPTAEYLKDLASKNSRVNYVQRTECWNLGRHYRAAIKEARGEYFLMVPGDNETRGDAVENILKELGKYDLVITYTENPEVRPLARRVISKIFVIVARLISGLNLKYFNGINLYKTDLLRQIEIKTDGFAYSAEILTKLLCSGLAKTYIEVPMPINPPEEGRTSAAFRWKNIRAVSSAVWGIFYATRIKGDPLSY